jgi:L-lactate dehydrogenase complex protein LldF
MTMTMAAGVLGSPFLFRFFGGLARRALKTFPGLMNNRFNTWGKQRDLPTPPVTSFASWYKKNRRGDGA